MGKFVGAAVLAFLGLGLVGDYPLIGFGFLTVAGLLVWMGLQGRASARVERARPVAARSARMDVQQEVNSAQRDANKQMRRAVERARREAQRNVDAAVARVRAEQTERWV
ncbi:MULTISPECIES: hypothetical protein [Mycobacteroides]|uniref:Uncharacterized protein n=1 Tax=Mycobacteroides immunogenum TaxID=83262 RepID=A0A7V8RTX4_9MYCO|nr:MULTISPECIES: hypothetical protein [Mycobacteroides]AMT69287.1 hypothetical protein ABG82_01900 [Mycobacteroides immunogenum]ANO02322.1 hypothetical protein BAB75_01890 [Mycobacteroides immunogenum]KIU37574.1 hypothetical protein TL11_26995 [Mycobacteroides immunogenum]KPG02319.1 hypothetical protein AN908_28095 [Mycobacteroides immunogenum]KPG02331.1 hypothetical protein AN909_27605 [Mycobacteroides immunogenum]